MTVFIANFGKGNEDWPLCRNESVIVTRATLEEYHLWAKGDRDAFIRHAMTNVKTVRGLAPIKPVASRWFQLLTIINETSGDTWIHREKNELWWTRSMQAPPVVNELPSAASAEPKTLIVRKSCEPWRKTTLTGKPLIWDALHPKARYFLFMEATFVSLSPQNAVYAGSLLSGDSLEKWHQLPGWVQVRDQANKKGGTVYDDKELTFFRMAHTALQTTKYSNGQIVQATVRSKDFGFKDVDALFTYIKTIFEFQEGHCALTSIPMELDRRQDDQELSCSLDRIDSAKGYEEGNLQIVCKFANRWKSSSNDTEFRRLINVLRGH
jgi:hypothetical protein